MSYERDKIIGLLYRIFQAEDYRWYYDCNSPSFEKLVATIESLENSAYEAKGFVESGRIRIEYDKETQTYDYYLNLGTA